MERVTSPVCEICQRRLVDGTASDLADHKQREHGAEVLARMLAGAGDVARWAACDRCGDRFHVLGSDEVRALAAVEADHVLACGGSLVRDTGQYKVVSVKPERRGAMTDKKRKAISAIFPGAGIFEGAGKLEIDVGMTDFTFDQLAALSVVVGTKAINIRPEDGGPGYSEVTPGDPSTVHIEVTDPVGLDSD